MSFISKMNDFRAWFSSRKAARNEDNFLEEDGAVQNINAVKVPKSFQ